MKNGLRLAKPKTSITSIAELKKVIKKYTELYFPKGAEDYGKGLKDGSSIALEKISEFEVKWRERLKNCEDAEKLMILKEVKISASVAQSGLAKQLRRILDGEAT